MSMSIAGRIDTVKASIKTGGRKNGEKHNATIKIDWTGCTEEDIFWYAIRQFKIRAASVKTAEGDIFHEGEVMFAKDYLPGDRAPRKPREMTQEEMLQALVKADPGQLKAKLAALGIAL